ncbi:MAG: DNA polymerase III subunit alpha [Bacteroidia bacterium]|nr:DNA polymerase III subunit alpha [Bacteroidia bacterium]
MLLNCHTYFSLCYGTLSVEELLQEVENKGHSSFVLSDINNTSGILEALRLTKDKSTNVIPGIDFRNGVQQKYIGIAKNNTGFLELNQHLSEHLHAQEPFEDQAPEFKNAFVVYPFGAYKNQALNEHTFIGISQKELRQLNFSPLKSLTHHMVVLQPLTFITKRHYSAHRLLRAIDKNMLLSMLPKHEQTTADEVAQRPEILLKTFEEYPEILKNTQAILDTCKVTFEFGKLANKNLKHYTGSKEGDIKKLRELSNQGLFYRYPKPDEAVYARIEKELEVIEKLNFASYYLINWDITQYARDKGYFYVGRGSGANSMIAYLLRITDVDPIELDLYFERFINEHRSNAPDFDIDFSWTDRDDVTRYIFERFKTKHTALLATYSTFQRDAVIRELGKVFGLPAGEIDRLQKVSDEKELDEIGKLVLKYSKFIHGFPSHLSIHASGIIISDEPVHAYTATILPPKGYPTTQFSMLEAEDIGLFKFDILSQRGLGKIKDAVDLIKENYAEEIDIHDVSKFKKDETVKELLRVGKCIGCFYVESPAMRMLLSKLLADDYLRLVAASSIIRPGVSKSGMMREYIVRFRNEEKRREAEKQNPVLYGILKETYGVMVYQEDVIKIAHQFAGLSLADADYLRRGMSWKFKQRNEFNVVKQKFYDNCRAKKYDEHTIDDIWTQIESFANFAFSKGHSASYAVESYQALYLKAHYPLEYMVATLNNGGGFYRKELYIHEARMHGATIVAPCINTSTGLCEIKDKTIFLGLAMLNEIEAEVIRKIVTEREHNGKYLNLYDFVKRTNISIEQLRILIRVGAFNSLTKNKKELLWEAHMLINPIKQSDKGSELFELEPERYDLPKLENNWLDDAMDEIELLGFSLCSPFKLLKEKIKNTLLSRDLKGLEGKTVEIIGYLVNVKNTGTHKGEKMCFGTFLDIKGYWIDTVHFPPSARAFPFSGPGCYRIIGKVVNEFDFIYIEVSHQYRLPVINRDDLESIEKTEFLNQ